MRDEGGAAASPFADEDRQLFQRHAIGSRQHNIAGGIIQLEALEGNGDEFAGKSGKIADGKDNVDIAVLAKNEIIDSSDLLALVVDHLL